MKFLSARSIILASVYTALCAGFVFLGAHGLLRSDFAFRLSIFVNPLIYISSAELSFGTTEALIAILTAIVVTFVVSLAGAEVTIRLCRWDARAALIPAALLALWGGVVFFT